MAKKNILLGISLLCATIIPLSSYADYYKEAAHNVAQRDAYERQLKIELEAARLKKEDDERLERERQKKIKILTTLLLATGYIIYGAVYITYQLVKLPIILAINIIRYMMKSEENKTAHLS